MKLDDFDYKLPVELIAQAPAARRDQSRLLVLERESGNIKPKKFSNILDFLNKGDLLVLNNSKVFPARIFGKKESTGGTVEILLNHQIDSNTWEVIGKNLKKGARIKFADSSLIACVLEKKEQTAIIFFNLSDEKFISEVEKIGHIPLPPYIKRTEKQRNRRTVKQDQNRYQTVYAKEKGSVAAPTAGLHFTEDLLNKISRKGINIAYLTLHVGIGTFAPVKTENIKDHIMHEEYYTISYNVIQNIIDTKKAGKRVVAVGTTTTRVLEALFQPRNINAEECMEQPSKKYSIIEKLTNSELATTYKLEPKAHISGSTNIFIYPPYNFNCVDALITNFHLPKSSLLMLVSAFAGKKNIDLAYQYAIENKFRFFSYGDAMFIT